MSDDDETNGARVHMGQPPPDGIDTNGHNCLRIGAKKIFLLGTNVSISTRYSQSLPFYFRDPTRQDSTIAPDAIRKGVSVRQISNVGPVWTLPVRRTIILSKMRDRN